MNRTRVSSSKSSRLARALIALAVTGLTLLGATALAADGDIERVSLGLGGAEGDGPAEFASLSADGRFVAFDSDATNLVEGDTNARTDVFVHDRATGDIERVSVSSSGAQAAFGSSREPAISADGRFVAFHSTASDLAPGDENSLDDVFVHDRETGETERLSPSAVDFGSTGSDAVSISANGRFVAFESTYDDLVPGDGNGALDVFVNDRQTGTTERVSVNSAGAEAEEASFNAELSADGRLVAFISNSGDLVSGDTNGDPDAFVHDRETGVTSRVSVGDGELQANGGGTNISISPDGRLVAFSSFATNLVAGDTNDSADVFVRDRTAETTERISLDSAGGQADADSFLPSVSADGRLVAFASSANNLGGTANAFTDVFLHDRQTGSTALLSGGVGSAAGDGHSFPPAISADGCFVAFTSGATNLVGGDTNGFRDAFVHDLLGCAPEPPPDTTPPALELRAKERQRLDKPVKVKASCDEDCAMSAKARAKLPGGKRLRLLRASADLVAGEAEKLKLKASDEVERKLRRAGRAKVKVTAIAADAAGNEAEAKVRVKLRVRP